MNLRRQRILLAAALLLLLAAAWIEPAGSWLGEPDEARYAEIPREMLATGDFVTPRLNGVPYLEKPPLLSWCTAAAFSIFGETPWAARLTARLAGAGTVGVLVGGIASIWGPELALAAGILYLVSPLGFVLSRLNVTDGLLTFFFVATLFSARETLLRREAARSSAAWSALAGASAAGAFLTKGLIAIVLPAGILLLWCLASKRTRLLTCLLFAPAPIVFLALVVPWLALVERRNPGFLNFFFIHEHFERFATKEAHRAGPPYYFVGIFLAGFLPGLPFFFAALPGRPLWRRLREDSETLFFLAWFCVVFLFFSLSSSKLPPYLLPAFPAAAALAARGAFGRGAGVGRWRIAAILATLLPAGVALHPVARQWIAEYGLLPISIAGFALLLGGSWAALPAARRSTAAALAALAVGWFGFYAAAGLAWPRVPPATERHNIEIVTREAAARSGALVVGYEAYLQGLPWELEHPVPVVTYTGELEPQFERRPGVRDALFWSRDRFWQEWRSEKKMIAVVGNRDLGQFAADHIVTAGRKYSVVANFGEK